MLEDDYDSEFRYGGRPLAALQGLDDGVAVLYVGSFSKPMFPALRLGYLVAPEPLLESFRRARAALDDYPGPGLQPALAAFGEGHFGGHVRQMRRRYAARQAALISAVRTYLPGVLEVEPDPAGLHLIARPTPPLARRMDDLDVERAAAAAGVAAVRCRASTPSARCNRACCWAMRRSTKRRSIGRRNASVPHCAPCWPPHCKIA